MLIFAIATIASGIAFVVGVIALGRDVPDTFVGLFVSPQMPARPQGVQEMDLPPFVFRDSTTVGTSAA